MSLIRFLFLFFASAFGMKCALKLKPDTSRSAVSPRLKINNNEFNRKLYQNKLKDSFYQQ